MNRFEFRICEADEHLAGHVEVMIDGVHGEYTNDPKQHLEEMTAQCLADGFSGPELILEAEKRALAQSFRVLDRLVDRLKRGSMIPGGIPAGNVGMLNDTRVPRNPPRNAAEAVAAFLNRGKLNGLSDKQRLERLENLNKRTDHEAEWKAGRRALILDREQRLEAARIRLKAANDLSRPKIEREIAYLLNEIRDLSSAVLNASHGFQYAFGQYLQAAVNFVTSDQRIWPLMTTTTVDTERDGKTTFAGFTTIGEFDGANYTAGGLTLATKAVNIDDANDRAEFDADDITVTALGAGTASIQGVCLGLFVTDTAASMPEHWLEFATNKTPDGSNFTFQFNAEGILQASG